VGQLLGTSQLEWMRDVQERAMPGTVVIERFTSARDAMGGFTDTPVAVGTVTGRIYPQNTRSFDEPIMGERVTSEGRWFATFPVGTDVTAEDRLVFAGRTYEVVRVNNDESWQTAVRCEVVTYNEERRA
jgi:head-tail adaptor